MWKAWDLAVDMALAQLADIVDGEKRAAYESSYFFEEQLTAFEVWLRYGNEERQPPEQLPIVLQVSGVTVFGFVILSYSSDNNDFSHCFHGENSNLHPQNFRSSYRKHTG